MTRWIYRRRPECRFQLNSALGNSDSFFPVSTIVTLAYLEFYKIFLNSGLPMPPAFLLDTDGEVV